MKTKTAVLSGKPDAGNPHVRFDEGEVASAKPRRGSLLYIQANHHDRLVSTDCCARWKAVLFLFALGATFASFGAEIAVDFTRETGPVKPVNAVGQPPITSLVTHDMFHYLKEAGIPYSRLHDTYGEYGSNVFVDVPNIFRDFDADEENPESYDFAFTDILIKNLIANGVEPFYRLGVTIENYPQIRAYRIRPPKDEHKWARICEHIVRHYTKGWANGFNYKIAYWEIWNEADINPDPNQSMMWQGTFAEYCRLYEITSKHLKKLHPEIKVGGYASCGFGAVIPQNCHERKKYWLKCNRDFLAFVRDRKCPLDFFSYHSYDDIDSVMREIDAAEKTLAEFGFAGTETWLNEWLPQPAHWKLGTAQQAAEIAGMLLAFQNSPLSAACIYDARCGIRNYSPLFNPLTFKPHKAYYAFMAFKELRDCGTAVATTVKDPAGLRAAAAKAGSSAALMVANPTDKAVPLKLDVGAWRVLSCRMTDGTRTLEEADLPEALPPWSFAVLCLAPPMEGKPWLIVNEDNDHYFKNPPELMTEKDLAEYIDYTCRGPVTHFFMCPSGQRASFESKTWEPIWKGTDEIGRPDTATGPNGTRDRWCLNAKLLCDKGIDPYAVWTKRCRERGVSPWLTLRMNDVHHMTVTNYFRNTTFCKTRRDLWINPDGKGWADRSLDYAKKDARDYMMAHVKEVVGRYDVDGIELDWMRFTNHLRYGHEKEDAHHLTGFVRDVRAHLDAVGAKRGRRIALGVRVCYDPDIALARTGLDVEAWAKEGLVDLVVPTGLYYADAGIAVRKWIGRIGRANPKVRVIPNIDYCHKQNGQHVWMNMAKFRWVADRFFRQGATGIYLFNLPYLGKYPTDGKVVPTDLAAEVFAEGLTPESVRGKPQEPIDVFHDFP